MKSFIRFVIDCLDYFYYRVARLAIVGRSLLPYDTSAATVVAFCIWAAIVFCTEVVLSFFHIHHTFDYAKYPLFAILILCYFVFNEKRYKSLEEKYKAGIKHKRLKDSIIVLVWVSSVIGLIITSSLPK